MSDRTLIGTTDAAAILGISAAHMRRLIVRGTVPSAGQLGGGWVLDRAAVIAYGVTSGRITPLAADTGAA